MGAQKIVEFLGRGEARLYGSADNVEYVGHRAPATVSAQYDITWPAAAPAGPRLMQVSAAGVISFIAAAGAGTLDQAYDFGGAGAGRLMTADTGPVEIAGPDGLQITHTDPAILWETTGAGDFNWKTGAFSDDTYQVQRGDQDADVSDDIFETIFALDGVNRRLGINTVAPGTLAHLLSPSGDAKLTIEAPASSDSSVIFDEGGTAMWEVGYDESASGLVIGRLSFTNPALFVEDTTGDVGIGEVDPDAKLHVTGTVAGVALLESSDANSRLGLRASGTTDETKVYVGANGDNLKLGAGGNDVCTATATGFFGVNISPIFRFDVLEAVAGGSAIRSRKTSTGTGDANQFLNAGSQSCLLLDQDGSGKALQIDSESTVNPLIQLQQLTANVRGDIAFSTARIAAPSAPAEGDLWYNAGLERMELKTSLGGVFEGQTVASRYGANYGLRTVETIAAGVVTISSGYVQVAADGGGTDNLDTITSASPVALPGDTIVLTADIGDTITVTEAGNILLTGTTRVLGAAGTVDTMLLIKRSDSPETWAELSYSNNS